MTMCYCIGRVRVIVDKYNCVVKTPRVGFIESFAFLCLAEFRAKS